MTCCGNYCLAFCVVTVFALLVSRYAVRCASGVNNFYVCHCMALRSSIAFNPFCLACRTVVVFISCLCAIIFACVPKNCFVTRCSDYKFAGVLNIFLCLCIICEYLFAALVCACVMLCYAVFCASCFLAGNLYVIMACSLNNGGGAVLKDISVAYVAFVVIIFTTCCFACRCEAFFGHCSCYCVSAECFYCSAVNKFAANLAEICCVLCKNKLSTLCAFGNFLAVFIYPFFSRCRTFNKLAVSTDLVYITLSAKTDGLCMIINPFIVNSIDFATISTCVLSQLRVSTAFSSQYAIKKSMDVVFRKLFCLTIAKLYCINRLKKFFRCHVQLIRRSYSGYLFLKLVITIFTFQCNYSFS